MSFSDMEPPVLPLPKKRGLAPPNSVIGVFGLSVDTVEEDLREAFAPYGQINRINMISDRETGKFKCFAFIYFERLDDAKRALSEKHETELKGNIIRIDYSVTARAPSTRGMHPRYPYNGYEHYDEDDCYRPQPHLPPPLYDRRRERSPERYYRASRPSGYSRYDDRPQGYPRYHSPRPPHDSRLDDRLYPRSYSPRPHLPREYPQPPHHHHYRHERQVSPERDRYHTAYPRRPVRDFRADQQY